MAITVVSTTDTKQSVVAEKAAEAVAQPVKSDETKSASEAIEASEETTDESDTSENDAESSNEDSDEEQDESLEAKTKDDHKPRKNGAEKRIKKLVTERNVFKDERDYWKQEALKRKGPADEAETAPKAAQKTAASTEGKPSPDDFDTHADYVDALADWKVEQKLKERDQREQETRVKTEYQKRTESFRSQVKTFQETHKDFAEVIEDIDDIPMSLTVQEILLDADNGPELMYEMAKNRKEYERICRMDAKSAAFAMGQLAVRIEKQTEAKKPEAKKSNAPAPISPVGQSSASVAKSIYDPNVAKMSQREYEKFRRAQMAQQD